MITFAFVISLTAMHSLKGLKMPSNQNASKMMELCRQLQVTLGISLYFSSGTTTTYLHSFLNQGFYFDGSSEAGLKNVCRKAPITQERRSPLYLFSCKISFKVKKKHLLKISCDGFSCFSKKVRMRILLFHTWLISRKIFASFFFAKIFD